MEARLTCYFGGLMMVHAGRSKNSDYQRTINWLLARLAPIVVYRRIRA
jgi:hypothetical protein